ncbi:hypothetical protein ABZ815_51010 [Nonomuraea sp. NPDC047529]
MDTPTSPGRTPWDAPDALLPHGRQPMAAGPQEEARSLVSAVLAG